MYLTVRVQSYPAGLGSGAVTGNSKQGVVYELNGNPKSGHKSATVLLLSLQLNISLISSRKNQSISTKDLLSCVRPFVFSFPVFRPLLMLQSFQVGNSRFGFNASTNFTNYIEKH